MNSIHALTRSNSIGIADPAKNTCQALQVKQVKNSQLQSESSRIRRTLDAYGIDDNRENLSNLNQAKHNVLIQKNEQGEINPKYGAFVSKQGVDAYGSFHWLNPKTLTKYQTDNLVEVAFTSEDLEALQSTYKKENTTEFLVNLLRGNQLQPEDDVYSTTFKKNPNAFYYSKPLEAGNGFLIYPNIPYMSDNYTNGSHDNLRMKREGIQLTAWAIHPALPHNLIQEITNKEVPRKFSEELNQQVAEEQSNVKSLTSILDLSVEDVGMLEKLKSDIIQHLADTYGVDKESDKVSLFFHFPVAPKTATIHLHIWVNKADHPLNESRGFGLDEIIQHLKSGNNIENLILSRNNGHFILPAKDKLHLITGMPESQQPTEETRNKTKLPI
ncbi:m7GpppX diphosphatase [Spartinivicinus ruber]|uniref:hypothetical protein n=1 Tax=Spartinivicinus ruber TaxID=2683272 RepID=UPI0013D70251|nr:hypothetical protein [Spartinivicinus ruber]